MTAISRASSVIVTLLVVLTFVAFSPAVAHATTPTTTTLTVTSPCLIQGCAVTLSAKVTAGSTLVHPGLVYFCDGSTAACEGGIAIGHAQITASGIATIVTTLSPNAHSVYAVFVGNSTYASSTSSTQALAIALPSPLITVATLDLTPPAQFGSTYQLFGIANTLNNGSGPYGTLSFLDIASGSTTLGTSQISGPGFSEFQYLAGQLDFSQVPAGVLSDISRLASGDFNNDGFKDIVVVGVHGVHVLLGSASGRFTLAPSSSPNLGTSSADLIVADFNSDGKLDIAAPDASTHALHVSLGNGDGTFTDAAPTTMTNAPQNAFVGDFNADGIPDLVVNVQTPSAQNPSTLVNALQIALGKGDGTFTPQSATYLAGQIGTAAVLIGDEDKDGKQDITVADSGTYASQLQVLHGNGDGTFTPLAATTQTTATTLMAGGDFDADGIPDVFTYDGSNINIWLGVGDGTFTPPPAGDAIIYLGGLAYTSLFTGDFNHDGVLDVAGKAIDPNEGDNIAHSVFAVYVGSYSGSPEYVQFVDYDFPNLPDTNGSTTTPGYLIIDDFNSDGTPDFVDFTPAITPQTTNFIGSNTISNAADINVTLAPGPHQLIAKYSGDSNHTASVSQPVNITTPQLVGDGNGFTDPTAISLNGGATLQGGVLQLTDGQSFEARSAFNPSRLPVYDFSTTFDFQIPDQNSDGLAFVIQSNGPNAIGSNGGGIGYGLAPGATTGASIVNSLALVFDTHNNQGEGANSIRVETGGITSPAGSVDLTPSGIDLHSGHQFQAQIVHIETAGTLALTLTDLTTNKVFTHNFSVDLFGDIGDTEGYVGFTAATGATASTVKILNWVYYGQRCCDTISSNPTPYFPNGFANGGSSIKTYNGSAVVGNALQLTNSTNFESTSTYFVGDTFSNQWSTDFDFSIGGTGGDGFTFFRSLGSYGAIGDTGGALGYAGPYKALYQPPSSLGFGTQSFAIKFDLHNNAGEGPNSTGLFYDGAYPSTPAIDLYSSHIDLHSGHKFHARISYFHGAINLSITDLDSYAVFTTRFSPSQGIPFALVGFTAATGATTNTINILNWTFDQSDVDP